MKSMDKKDQPKLIALIGLAVVAFGYGIYTLTGGAGAQAPAPPTEQATARKDPAEAAAEAAAAEGDADRQKLLVLARLNEPNIPRDPFMPSGPASTQPTPAPTPVPDPKSSPLPGTNAWHVQSSKTTNLVNLLNQQAGRFGAGALGSAPEGNPSPLPIPSPPPPTLSASAVVLSERPGDSVAILRNGDERLYVSEGDPVGNGFIVSAIRRTEVVIIDAKNRKRFQTIKLP